MDEKIGSERDTAKGCLIIVAVMALTAFLIWYIGC